MEDYTLTLAFERQATSRRFLQGLAAKSSRVQEQGRGFLIDERTFAELDQDEPSVIHLRGATPSGLFLLLEAFFGGSHGSAAGAIVALADQTEFRAVFISNDEDTDFGTHELGINVEARELLAAEATFVSAWPNLISASEDFEPFAPDEPVVETGLPADGMLVRDLLGAFDTERDEVSYLIFGTSPKAVLEQLLRVPAYVVSDDEYLTAPLEEIEDSIVAVSFNTSEGSAVELRIPLPANRVSQANLRLSEANAKTLQVKIGYVGEVDFDQDDVFLVQTIDRLGRLEAPRRVSLVFD